MRFDTVLTDSIREIGLKAASGDGASLYFQNIPKNHTNGICIDEYDGTESVRFDCGVGLQRIILDNTITPDEKLSQMTELCFININKVFRKIRNINV
jgi:hypothetical protein